MDDGKSPPDMDAERWKRIETVLDGAMSLAPEEHSAFLDRACAGDRELRRDVESFLAADEGSPGVLEAPSDECVAHRFTEAKLGDPNHDIGEGQRIGPYRLMQKIGEGGMGVVYEAEQEQPIRRRVALKIIKPGMDSKQVLARFEAERQALALMDHPAVAKVFEAGATPRGRPYFAMEFVQGVPITERCDEYKLTNRERLELFLQVCDGVQHAHQKGIIHRDLKPSNVLVSIQGSKAVPKIIDFGVAKATAQKLTERTLFTELGVLIGTPAYMSPEQAEMTGQNVDTRSDVYSLGVMLYQLLVGALPFDPNELRRLGFEGIRQKIREEEPPKPSTRLSTLGDRSSESAKRRRVDLPTLQRQLRGDLDWITMKALDKDRTRRYGSPSELAADIRRHLDDLPVLAGPPSSAYRVAKFARRHKVLLTAVSLILATLILGLAASTILYFNARNAGFAERAQRVAAQRQGYVAHIAAAQSAIALGKMMPARMHLDACPEQLRNWEWDYLRSRLDDSSATLHGHTNAVWQVAFSPDGKRIASGSRDGDAVIWDAATGSQETILHLGVAVFSVAFRPDGKVLATGSEAGLTLWDVESGNRIASTDSREKWVRLRFSPDGTWIATCNDEGTVRLWNADLQGTPRELADLGLRIYDLTFDPDGRRLATASRDNTLRIWDTTGEELIRIDVMPASFRYIHSWGLSFSPDGSRVASGSHDGSIRIWDASTGDLMETMFGHGGRIRTLAFHPDGSKLLSGSEDESVRMFDVESGELIARFLGHGEPVMSLGLSPSGDRLVSGGWQEGSIKVWDLSEADSRGSDRGPAILTMDIDAEGERIVASSQEGWIRIIDAATADTITVMEGHRSPVSALGFSPDGARVYSGSDDGELGIWDATTGELLSIVVPEPGRRLLRLVLSPAGDWLATYSDELTEDDRSPRIELRDARSVQVVGTLSDVGSGGWVVPAFSPDGNWLVASLHENLAGVWEVPGLRLVRKLEGHTGPVYASTFSRDGTMIATSSQDGTVRVWDSKTGELLQALEGHTAPTDLPSFSPDGTRIAGGGRDGTVLLWDIESGQIVLTLNMGLSWVGAVFFSPDGSWLATHSDAGVEIWDTRPRVAGK